jgi:regulator of cell morphogenesis and NO signaling
VHRAHPAVPAGLSELLGQIGAELAPHMEKEEQVLFPLMRRGGYKAIGSAISVMLAEHDDHGTLLRELETVTQDFTAPEDACNTWRALYLGSRKFADDLVEHIHTENNVLFPRFGG